MMLKESTAQRKKLRFIASKADSCVYIRDKEHARTSQIFRVIKKII